MARDIEETTAADSVVINECGWFTVSGVVATDRGSVTWLLCCIWEFGLLSDWAFNVFSFVTMEPCGLDKI